MEDYCLIANVSALHSISTDVSAYNPMENRVLRHLQRYYSFAHKYAVGNIIAIQPSRTAKFIDHRGIEAIMTLDHGVCEKYKIGQKECNDDPDIGTNICGGGGGGSGTCKSSGGDGGGPSECDERVVALSTGWYNDGSRCGKMIKIRATNGRTTTAKVVDECDSQNGCDDEHAGQPPCRNNIVDGSNVVWNALGLDTNLGVVDVT
ncbi:hypothetical protein G4B88_007572 [Cannabis sativa]|uniref:Uncharacterized protein n=1 Tax=Cannabis sativa TaxID=3483 RepID=A0A7J6HSM2_CANSA|nr:hypothetical protein G4B88_007572 [Cannabis sativa]